MPKPNLRSSYWRTFALLLGALTLGFPVAILAGSAALTFLSIFGPLLVINYLLWGWWLAPDAPSNGNVLDTLEDWSSHAPMPHSQGIRSKEQGEHYTV